MTSITRLHKDSRRSCLSNKSSKRKRRKTSSLCPASRCPPLLISQSKATSVTLQFDLDWIISLCVALCFVSPWLLCLCCCCCSGLTSEYPWKDCQIIHVVSVVNHPVLTKTLWIAAYILSLCVDARRWMSNVPIVQDQMPSLRFFHMYPAALTSQHSPCIYLYLFDHDWPRALCKPAARSRWRCWKMFHRVKYFSKVHSGVRNLLTKYDIN